MNGPSGGWAALVLVCAAAAARAEDAAARGEKVFRYCYSCHSVEAGEAGEAGLQGPNLRGIVGAEIASRDSFDYSPAMRAFAQRNGRWSEALLDRYLAAPYEVVPKTSMSFPGVDEADERADLIAYLRSAEAPP